MEILTERVVVVLSAEVLCVVVPTQPPKQRELEERSFGILMNSCAFSLPSFASDSPGEAVRRTESGARAVTQYMDKDYGKRSGRHCMAVYRRAVSRGRIQTV